jgi:hypothetical protein
VAAAGLRQRQVATVYLDKEMQEAPAQMAVAVAAARLVLMVQFRLVATAAQEQVVQSQDRRLLALVVAVVGQT